MKKKLTSKLSFRLIIATTVAFIVVLFIFMARTHIGSFLGKILLGDDEKVEITLVDRATNQPIANKNVEIRGFINCQVDAPCNSSIFFQGITNEFGKIQVNKQIFDYQSGLIDLDGYYGIGPMRKKEGTSLVTYFSFTKSYDFDYKKDPIIIKFEKIKSKLQNDKKQQISCKSDNECVLKPWPLCCDRRVMHANRCYHIDEEPPKGDPLKCQKVFLCPLLIMIKGCQCEGGKCLNVYE